MRERSSPGTVSQYVENGFYYPQPSGTPIPIQQVWYLRPQAETIKDEVGRRHLRLSDGRRVPLYKSVWHQKWNVVSYAQQALVWANWNHGGKATVSAPGQMTQFCGNNTDWGSWLVNLMWAKCGNPFYRHYDRWLSAKPSMASRANLAVFLAELRDITRMFRVIPVRHLKVFGTGEVIQDWRTLLKYVNSQHLSYNFGWKPFLRDIKNTMEALRNFESRLNKFVRQAGQQISQRQRDAPTTTSYSENTGGSGFWGSQINFTVTEEWASCFSYSYSLPPYSADEFRWRGYLDAVGLNVTPKMLWQIVPWSFVADWFYNTSNLLEELSNDWIVPWIYWNQACCSYKLTAIGNWHAWNYYNEILPGFGLSLEFYRREVCTPTVACDTPSLDADKIRLGSSLLLSLMI